MHLIRHFVFAVMVLASLAGCGTSIDSRQVEADRFTLYSIDGNFYPPVLPGEPSPLPADVERFHRWPVLGKTEITDRAQRTQLLEAMQQGIDDSDGSAAACFIPRHAIQIVTGDKTTDYVICFQCLQINIYETIGGQTKESYKLTTGGPQRVFDAQLRQAGLPLSK